MCSNCTVQTNLMVNGQNYGDHRRSEVEETKKKDIPTTTTATEYSLATTIRS